VAHTHHFAIGWAFLRKKPRLKEYSSNPLDNEEEGEKRKGGLERDSMF
jgi:hypothetical protein